MTSRTLDVHDIITPDSLATRITEKWQEWDSLRQNKKNDWEEIRRYVYATDTTQTTNASLPWKNKTTVPKLCHIRDNLFANYMATMFPQRNNNIIWEANEQNSNSVAKRDAIQNYMNWVLTQPSFKQEMEKVVLDYIDFGNCFLTVDWVDERTTQPNDTTSSGYVGPMIKRISPLDIVFNPTAESFQNTPKIVRSMISLGELKKLLNRLSGGDNAEEYQALFDYLKEIRHRAQSFQGDWTQKDNLYAIDGFSSFRAYLQSDSVEVLTFYGDIYDYNNDEILENHVITVVDRHKLIGKKPNPTFFPSVPIYHVPWRRKQDNLWGMGPLDNLVGMQYRLDHIENMKADIFDLTTYPVQKVKGFVEDFVWQPGEKIYVSEEGDVELVTPDVNIMTADMAIERLMNLMELMAGAPKEAMGFRTPGEKTKYEVQQLENAAARVFSNKIKQFEEQEAEPAYNALLELARRNLVGVITIKIFDDEFKVASFQELTAEDITGIGRIKPVAARHFAEQADTIQNLTQLASSNLWPIIQPHTSGVKLSKLFEDYFGLTDREIFVPYVGLAEQADAQKQINALEQQVFTESQTPSGIGADFNYEAIPQQ